jgi:hypothetical protein
MVSNLMLRCFFFFFGLFRILRVPIEALQVPLVLRPYFRHLRSIRNIILARAYLPVKFVCCALMLAFDKSV